jgi:hypothetical protein
MTGMIVSNATNLGDSVEKVYARHESFMSDPFKRFQQMETVGGVHVCVGAEGHSMLEMHKRFPSATWCYTWREPTAQLLSIAALRNRHYFGAALSEASEEWGAREWELRQAEKLGIELTHWHFDFVTKAEGFTALMRNLGIALRDPLTMKPPTGETGPMNKVCFTDWSGDVDEMKKIAVELFESHEYVKAAYDQARRS